MRRVALSGLALLLVAALPGLAQLCPPGSYSANGTAPCALCPVGTFGSVAGATACAPCAIDSYASTEGAIACASCPAGTSTLAPGASQCCTDVPCPAGRYSADGNQPCNDCPVGTFADTSGNVQCAQCPAGTFNSLTGMRACATCLPGTYSEAGSGTCTKCPAGTFSATFGAGSAEACLVCPPGRYSPEGSSECLPCVPGTFSAQPGQSECLACEAGTYSNIYGAAQCLTCEAGQTSEAGATECQSGDCPPGRYSETGSAPCSDCPIGTYAAGSGNESCTACPPGRYGPVAGQSQCLLCPAGKFSDAGSSVCTDCPAGTFSNAEESGACTQCPEGMTSLPGSTECSRTAIRITKIYDPRAGGTGEELSGWRAIVDLGALGSVPLPVELPAEVSVAPGTYRVDEVMPGVGWVLAAPGSVAVTVAAGETVEVRFANACLGGGGAHAPSFWAKKNGEAIAGDDGGPDAELAALRALNLRDEAGADFDPATFEALREWLRGASGKNMAYALSAQLAAMHLAIEAAYVSPDAHVHVPELTPFGIAGPWGFTPLATVLDAANDDLATNLYPPPGSPARAVQGALKDALERANANQNFVSPVPCPFVYASDLLP